MADQQRNRRRRLRFSVRNFLIFMALACGYAACWGPTKSQGVRDVHRTVYSYEPAADPEDRRLQYLWLTTEDVAVTAPLVLSCDPESGKRRCYYFWFFGYVAKLPFERTIQGSDRIGGRLE